MARSGTGRQSLSLIEQQYLAEQARAEQLAGGAGRPSLAPRPSRRPQLQERVVSARPSLRRHLLDIWVYRELLVSLVRKEITVKYKNSALGMLWSMLNPAFILGVYYFVFQIVLKNGIPFFAFFLMSGLLVWNLFQTAIPGGTGAVVGNTGLVKKVAFPREILALASVGTALVFFFFQSVVLIFFIVVFRYSPSLRYLPLVPLALLALVIFTASLAVFLSAVNVRMRDTQHLIEIVLLAWFWASPIVYGFAGFAQRLPVLYERLYRLNPVLPIVLTFQRAFYNKLNPPATVPPHPRLAILPVGAGEWWYAKQDLAVLAGSIVLFILASWVFLRMEGNLAEDL